MPWGVGGDAVTMPALFAAWAVASLNSFAVTGCGAVIVNSERGFAGNGLPPLNLLIGTDKSPLSVRLSSKTLNESAIAPGLALMNVLTPPLRALVLRDLALRTLALRTLALRDLALRDLALRDLALRDLALRDLALRDLALRDLALRDLALRDLALRDLALRDLALRELALRELALRDLALRELAVRLPPLCDSMLESACSLATSSLAQFSSTSVACVPGPPPIYTLPTDYLSRQTAWRPWREPAEMTSHRPTSDELIAKMAADPSVPQVTDDIRGRKHAKPLTAALVRIQELHRDHPLEEVEP